MKMDHDDKVCYKKFADYVRCSLPTVADVPAIVRAFQKYGQIDRTTLRRALKWENLPTIKITDLDGIYGEFTPGIGSNEIRIDTQVVKDFCAGRGVLLTKGNKPIYLAGVTLLHELVHWADDQDGIDYDVDPDDDHNDEEGELFEIDCYGGVIG